MKKNIKVLFFIFTLALTFTYVSCTDENKFTNPVTFGLENGAFATFNAEVPAAAYPDPTDIVFSDQITDPNGTMTAYNVKLIANLSGNTRVVEDFFTATSFPADMSFTSQSIASALGIEISDIAFGDTFNFIATATREDGTEFTGIAPAFDDDTLIVSGGNTEPTLQNPNYKSAMQWNFIIACPFVQDDFVGTFTVVDANGFHVSGGGSSGAGETFEIIAGSNPNEIILINPFASNIVDARITITVSEFGIASFDWQDAFQTSEICCAGYTNTQLRSIPDQTSLALACTGYLELKFNTRLGSAGGPPTGFTFGDGFIIAQKN
jgi:hypothetical protein